MKAYQCQRTGLYFSQDFYENWGVDGNGVGLGPEPCSEALISNYASQPVWPNGRPDDAMLPVAMCRAALVLVDVAEDVYNQGKAILAKDDPTMTRRAALMRDKQLQKSPNLRATINASKPLPTIPNL